MIINVANPIYDTVFKYLMEDERIAKTILSALLKKDIVKVKVRPHEYANTSRDLISMFRIDFAATLREQDGREHLVLIELQKTWVETETLRFRQYLGAQYSNKANMQEDGKGKYAIPMVTVYLLGHRVGDISEPVIYVDHKAYDYDGNEVTKGLPDPFVDSLVHNSIIVQIPLLHGKVNNRLEKVLSVFDQTKVNAADNHVVRIDDTAYADDADMEYILRRLLSAASNPMMRQDMNVEDEYFSAIENRDTAIMSRDKTIAAQNNQLAEKDSTIARQNSKLAEKDSTIARQDAVIHAMVKAMATKGMTEDAIAQITGLPVEKIKALL